MIRIYCMYIVISLLALILNILFVMSGLAFLGTTPTLPEIAGIILTIGMAVYRIAEASHLLGYPFIPYLI